MKLTLSFLPFVALILLLFGNVYYFSDDAGSGPNQIALLIAAAITILYTIIYEKRPWKEIEKMIVASISKSMPAIIILLLIGCLTVSWLISGIIPTMIFYGATLLNPDWFLSSACILCALVSVSIGSSWSTVATIGIALMGVGKALGIHDGMVAGAIISGAYFGDKLSPLSDTTNLAPAMAGTDLVTHIKYLLYTTIPTFTITLILFSLINLNFSQTFSTDSIDQLNKIISQEFYVTPLLFIVPLMMIGLILMRVPVMITLFLGTLIAILCTFIFQSQVFKNQIDISVYGFIIDSLANGYQLILSNSTGGKTEAIVEELFNSGGMRGMLNTVWLILCAMIFGGTLEVSGILKNISKAVLKLLRGAKSLIISNSIFCIFTNLTTSDQYISIILPAEVFKKLYHKFKLKPENMSRTLEDSGTVTSVLIPWNTCGAVQASILGVSTLTYLPFTYFCLISPLMTIFVVAINYKIRRIDD